jgi:hypothetical protein
MEVRMRRRLRDPRRVARQLVLLLGCAGPASICLGDSPRAFETTSPERLGADVCWSKRQIEKEQFENLRLEHMSCLEATGRSARTPSALADLDPLAGVTALPDEECQTTPATEAPLADRKTGLCSWQALSLYPKGEWVMKNKGRFYFGRDFPYTDYDRPGADVKHPCSEKKQWYRCPAFRHKKEWLPDIVKTRKCAMTYMTPSRLLNITGRPLRIILHGDSIFKATYKAFVCQLNSELAWEEEWKHPPRESHNAEVWLASFGEALLLQYNYRDGSFNFTSHLARHVAAQPGRAPPLMDLDDADMLITNYQYGSGAYAEMATRRGYNGPILGISHACARCRTADTAEGLRGCAENSVRKLDCARRAGALTLDYCAMTLPAGGYRAQWAPNGQVRAPARSSATARDEPIQRHARTTCSRPAASPTPRLIVLLRAPRAFQVMNSADPHICSPGPDNQLMNMILHYLASYFRK